MTRDLGSYRCHHANLSLSKHDLQARPIYHHKRESIDVHLTVVFAALAVTHRIEHQTGWSMKKLVRTARRYRTMHVRAGQQILTAADPYPRTSTKPSPRSTHQTVCTKLSQLGAADTEARSTGH
jgi:hypothetical protein